MVFQGYAVNKAYYNTVPHFSTIPIGRAFEKGILWQVNILHVANPTEKITTLSINFARTIKLEGILNRISYFTLSK